MSSWTNSSSTRACWIWNGTANAAGFPDLETTSFQVARVEGDGDDAVVHVKCEFDESVATSCAGISFPYPTFGEFTVALSAGDERGDVEYLSVYDDPLL